MANIKNIDEHIRRIKDGKLQPASEREWSFDYGERERPFDFD